MGIDILGIDILGVDILGIDILAPTPFYSFITFSHTYIFINILDSSPDETLKI